MLRRARFLITALALLATGAMAIARDARVQQARLRRLKACVLLIPEMTRPDPEAEIPVLSPNANPYVFYVLNNRTDLKPDGWQIYNPASPANATAAQTRRWSRITGNSRALPTGTPLRQDVAAYWEVALSEANFPQLLQMDVIYLPAQPIFTNPSPYLRFTERQRALLTRLADAGVTIWVDWAVNGATQANALGGTNTANNVRNAFFTNLDFAQSGGVAGSPSVGHPLLAGQFVLQPGDSLRLGSPYNGPGSQPSLARALNLRPLDMQPTTNFAAVVPTATAGQAYVAASRFGAGFVVGTAGNVGAAISTQGDGGNNGSPINPIIAPTAPKVTTEDIGRAEPEDLKFAYNVFAWASEVTAQGKNGRHTGQSNVMVNGVLEQASYPNMVPAGGAGQPWRPYPLAGAIPAQLPVSPASPLLINGTVVAATKYWNGNRVVSGLNVFEANPADDFDGNGFADDPINANTNPSANDFADLAIGLNYDRIMSYDPNNANLTFTGLTVGELPEALNNSTQQAKGYLFAAANTGLLSLPAPRAGLPAADFWSPAVASVAPNVDIAYTGAPAFANLPGASPGAVSSHVYAGGVAQNVAFGSAGNGRIVSFDVASTLVGGVSKAIFAPQWVYPPQPESNRMGAISGPISVAQVEDQGTGAIDTMVFGTSLFSGDLTSGGGDGQGAGDTTGKVEGFIVATRGDVLGFPRGQNAPGGNNPTSGRRFVSTRWLDVQPGVGQVPQTAELIWDSTRYYEVRVLDKRTGYVLRRFLPGTAGFTLLRDGTAGQIELPAPPAAWAVAGQPNMWDLSKVDLVADYSPLPIPVDTTGAPTLRPRFSPSTPYFRGTDNTVQPTGIAGGVAVGKDNLIYYGTGIGYMCAAEWRKGRPQFRWKMRSREYNAAGGQSQVVDPNAAGYLGDYAFTAAPAAGDRIVFAARQGPGGSPGTMYVMEPNAVIRFRLPISGALTPAQAQNVMLEGDHGLGLPQNDPFIASNTQPWGRVPGQFTVDPDTATVTFQNMENFSLDLNNVISARQALQAPYNTDTGGRPAVLVNWRLREDGLAGARPPAVVPLPIVEIYRPDSSIADHWISSPVLAGQKIFLAGQSGYLHELPANPKELDPNYPNPNLPGLEGLDLDTYGGGLRKVYNAGVVGLDGPVPSPAVGEGMIAVNTRRGLTMYGSPNVVIADSGRIIEASGDSTALTSTDAVLKRRIDTSEFAIPTDPAFANTGGRPILTERKLLNNPSKVLKLNRISSLTAIFASGSPNLGNVDTPNSIREHSQLADESYLAADTGNDRCIEFNPAGNVIWELKDFQDPYNLLPAGESLKLAGPMDVQRWVEPEDHPSLGQLQVVHTLIADTGNSRILEIVDKILPQRGQFNASSYPVTPDQTTVDGTPIRWYHVVVWSSQTNAQGLRLKYRTAQRVFWPQANGDLIPIQNANGSRAVSHFPGDPALPEETYLTYTMASVGNQRVTYPEGGGVASALNGYFRFYNLATPLTPAGMSVVERKPEVRSGGDSIVFLRGRWYMDETTPGTPIVAPLREEKRDPQGNVIATDTYRLSQGVIDPAVPTVTEIYDEMTPTGPASNNVVHRLNGIQSIQRTIRADVKFTPERYGAGSVRQMYAQYFLLADADGVWEYRLLPGPLGNAAPTNQPAPAGQARLAWAFTTEDYAYVTGAGNGDPSQIYTNDPTLNTPGGRRFTPSSARRLPSGMVLITSRTPANDNPLAQATNAFRQLYAGGDVFLLRASDYKTAAERVLDIGQPAAPYNRVNLVNGAGQPLHGWQPEQWVQNVYQARIPALLRGAPSLRWRAAEALDTSVAPYRRTQLGGIGGSPYELTGSYLPVQPTYADLVY